MNIYKKLNEKKKSVFKIVLLEFNDIENDIYKKNTANRILQLMKEKKPCVVGI